MSAQDHSAPYESLTEPPGEEDKSTKKTLIKIGVGVVMVLIILAIAYKFGLLSLLFSSAKHAWSKLKDLGAVAIPIVAVLCWLITSVAGPVFVIEVAAGALFQQMWPQGSKGIFIALVTCCFGVWMGCVTAFALGRKYLKHKVADIINQHAILKTVNEIISEEGWKFVFLIRLNPLIPFEFFNYAVAMTDITACHNAIAALGTLPIVCFEVYSAASAAELAASATGTGKHGVDQSEKIKETLIKLAISGVLVVVVCAYGKLKYDAKVSKRERSISERGSPSNILRQASFAIASQGFR